MWVHFSVLYVPGTLIFVSGAESFRIGFDNSDWVTRPGNMDGSDSDALHGGLLDMTTFVE